MDRRTILAVVLALTTFLLWDAWMNYRYPDRYAEVADTATESDGDALADAGETPDPRPVPEIAVAPEPVVAAEVPQIPERRVPFEACDVAGEWSTRTGGLRDVVLTDHQAAYEVQPIWKYLMTRFNGETSGPWQPYGTEPGKEQLLTDDAVVLGMGSGEWSSGPAPSEVSYPGEGTVMVRGTTDAGIEVTRFLRVEPGQPCTVDVTTTWRNTSGAPFDGGLWMQLHDVVPENPGRYDNAVQPYTMAGGKYEWVRLKKLVEPQAFEGSVDWMALSDRYFTLVLIPDAETRSGNVAISRVERGEADAFGIHYTVEASLAPGQAHTEHFRMYVGPKDIKILRDLDPSLAKLVNLGLFSFFGKILLAALRFFHTIVGQWGLAIILLTLSVKALFFPLTQASFKSSQAMSALQPELQGIREEFKDKPEELNRRTMELFRERGVNPLGGCLPMLVQFPVWIALYQVLLNSVELYHTEFLYLHDLSSVDPYGALPAVVVVLMVVQQQFMPTGNMDPAQARMMKLMPLLFGFFFFAFPSGLVVYIFVNMVLTIIQQWVIRRTWQQPTVAAATT